MSGLSWPGMAVWGWVRAREGPLLTLQRQRIRWIGLDDSGKPVALPEEVPNAPPPASALAPKGPPSPTRSGLEHRSRRGTLPSWQDEERPVVVRAPRRLHHREAEQCAGSARPTNRPRGQLSPAEPPEGKGHREREDQPGRSLPVIDRYRAQGQTVVVRADAAFALPTLYEALERRGLRYAIRLPANDVLERAIEDLLTRPRDRPSHPLVSGGILGAIPEAPPDRQVE